MDSLRLISLVDNVAGYECNAEFGFSMVIDNGDGQILFDTGKSSLYLENAEKLGIDISRINKVVLSHGHYDHGDGLQYINNKELICHPDSFKDHYRKSDHKYIGLAFDEEYVRDNFSLSLSKSHKKIAENIYFLGEIPRSNDFESQITTFCFDNKDDDYVLDDSGIAIITDKGLVIIAGCSHSGICNIVEHAINITGISNVHAVVGGFHLKDQGDVLDKTISYFKNKGIEKVYTMHCTGLDIQNIFHNEFGGNYSHSGMIIEI